MSKYFHRSLRKKHKGGSFFAKPTDIGNNQQNQQQNQQQNLQQNQQQNLQQGLPQDPYQESSEGLPRNQSPARQNLSPQIPPAVNTTKPSTSWFTWFFGNKVTNPFKTNNTTTNLNENHKNAGGTQYKRTPNRNKKRNKKTKSHKKKRH